MENMKEEKQLLNGNEMEEAAGGTGTTLRPKIRITKTTYVRIRPGKNDPDIGAVESGTVLKPLLHTENTDDRGVDWYGIEYDGRAGFISSRCFEFI